MEREDESVLSDPWGSGRPLDWYPYFLLIFVENLKFFITTVSIVGWVGIDSLTLAAGNGVWYVFVDT